MKCCRKFQWTNFFFYFKPFRIKKNGLTLLVKYTVTIVIVFSSTIVTPCVVPSAQCQCQNVHSFIHGAKRSFGHRTPAAPHTLRSRRGRFSTWRLLLISPLSEWKWRDKWRRVAQDARRKNNYWYKCMPVNARIRNLEWHLCVLPRL